MPPRVAVVVVTYNRKAMLLDCLEKVSQQTLAPAQLIIVDNASTDGTDTVLRECGVLDRPHTSCLRLPENTGGAGGFHAGFEAAMATDADWIWCMDDDVAPEPDCLERLLSFTGLSECIHPLVLYEDGSEREWEHLLDPTTTFQIGLDNASFRNGKTWCPMHVACFEGMLVSRRVVDLVGLPEREFFIYGDDTYFGFVAATRTNILFVSPARMIKKIKPGETMSPFQIYYDLRNRFLLRYKISRHIRVPKYSVVTFHIFLLCYTYAVLRKSFSGKSVLAAFRAWRDGARRLSGRRHY